MSAGHPPKPLELTAAFIRPSTGERAEAFRPDGDGFPADTRVRWVTPGPGREALNEVLGSVIVLELDHLAAATARGEDYTLGALREFATRDEWTLRPTPTGYDVQRHTLDGAPATDPVAVQRIDLLLAVELALREALEPFAASVDLPAWVDRARGVYPEVLEALGDAERFVPVT